MNPTAAKEQLHRVYERMTLRGRPGYEEIALAEDAFRELQAFLDLVPEDGLTELIFRLSEGVPATKVAELYNLLVWSGEASADVDLESIQEWFYSRQPRRIEIALQVDIFPSNSMEECQRILEEIVKKFPQLKRLCALARQEVDHRLAEEEAWSRYRRDTFEMPKEMTPSILAKIREIKKK
ncbi:hypothetical protein QWY85_03300 [Neolewinella lacunae]|uniref:Uncharacterized protein n=1 Tax=Neolewinella lacunae TaxID=1517758 RepID=A0A923PLS5_9BACT|nr:hypothetical protein [Neolewinella lacunae]MBC6996390.1 hypothetical protein [Neolewinella lacunae]MDN3633667.1 hypothetical protein [Neolewinella lacunae]